MAQEHIIMYLKENPGFHSAKELQKGLGGSFATLCKHMRRMRKYKEIKCYQVRLNGRISWLYGSKG